MKIFCLFGLLVIVSATGSEEDISRSINGGRGKLIFSHVLYRHGDRSPAASYPTDPYDESYWPVVWGGLTTLGMQQHFALGKWLRHRYGNILLSEHYTPNEIYIRSTDIDRAIQSAQANLAGLYPPHDDQIWNPELLWQPIPVHSVPAEDDWLVLGTTCPLYNAASQSLDTTREFLKIHNFSEPMIQCISQHSGLDIPLTIDGLTTLLLFRDTLFVEALYNLTLPAWTKEVYPSTEIDKLAQLAYDIPSYTPLLSKTRSGFLLKDIVDRSTQKYSGSLQPDISVYVYSAHDSVLASLMYALGISDEKFVQYTATLLFELRSFTTGPRIEIYYKKSSATDIATPLFIPNCGFSCPLLKFQKLYESIIPTEDYATTCQLPSA